MPQKFGTTESGETVEFVTIRGGGLTANVLTWGAVIQDLRLRDHEHPLVLGFVEFDSYPAHSSYFGAIAGRYANRIANGAFDIDGVRHQVDTNFIEKHCLHGGKEGISHRIWKIQNLSENQVTLTLTDPDGHMGFPGTVQHTCRYSLKDNGVLCVDLSASTDAATPVNLAQHSYFILDDGDDCREHVLQIEADTYLPVDGELIPTGEIISVDNTAFDFRTPKPIGEALTEDVIYDHNFCLSNARRQMQKIATVTSPKSGVSLSVATTEPGLQFYAGHKVSTPVPGLAGKNYSQYSGLALETQVWPDGPNNSHFPNSIVRPKDVWEQVTEYQFSKA